MRPPGLRGDLRVELRLGIAAAAIALCLLSLVSCVDLAADAELRADGSVALRLNYRVSRLVEAMGKVEGGDPALPLPADRDRFFRLANSIGGATLNSFSSTADEVDVSAQADLSFSDLASFVRFLQAAGRTATLGESGSRRTLALRLAEGGGPLDPELKRFVDAVFADYRISLRLKFPTAPSVAGGGSVDAPTRTASYAASVSDILSSTAPVVWTLTW